MKIDFQKMLIQAIQGAPKWLINVLVFLMLYGSIRRLIGDLIYWLS